MEVFDPMGPGGRTVLWRQLLQGRAEQGKEAIPPVGSRVGASHPYHNPWGLSVIIPSTCHQQHTYITSQAAPMGLYSK